METERHNGTDFYAPWVFEAAQLSTRGSQGYGLAPRPTLDCSGGAHNEPSAIRVAIRSSKRSTRHARRSLVLNSVRPLGFAAELRRPSDKKVTVASPETDPLHAAPKRHEEPARPETRPLVASRNGTDAGTGPVAAGVSTSKGPALKGMGRWLKCGWGRVSALCRGDKGADSTKTPSGHEKRGYKIKWLGFERAQLRLRRTSTPPWRNPRAKIWVFLMLAVVLAVAIEASVALGLASKHYTEAGNPTTSPGNGTQSASGISPTPSPPTPSSNTFLISNSEAVPSTTWTTTYPPSAATSSTMPLAVILPSMLPSALESTVPPAINLAPTQSSKASILAHKDTPGPIVVIVTVFQTASPAGPAPKSPEPTLHAPDSLVVPSPIPSPKPPESKAPDPVAPPPPPPGASQDLGIGSKHPRPRHAV